MTYMKRLKSPVSPRTPRKNLNSTHNAKQSPDQVIMETGSRPMSKRALASLMVVKQLGDADRRTKYEFKVGLRGESSGKPYIAPEPDPEPTYNLGYMSICQPVGPRLGETERPSTVAWYLQGENGLYRDPSSPRYDSDEIRRKRDVRIPQDRSLMVHGKHIGGESDTCPTPPDLSTTDVEKPKHENSENIFKPDNSPTSSKLIETKPAPVSSGLASPRGSLRPTSPKPSRPLSPKPSRPHSSSPHHRHIAIPTGGGCSSRPCSARSEKSEKTHNFSVKQFNHFCWPDEHLLDEDYIRQREVWAAVNIQRSLIPGFSVVLWRDSIIKTFNRPSLTVNEKPSSLYKGNATHQLYKGNATHKLYKGNATHQLYKGNATHKLYKVNATHKLYKGNATHQLYKSNTTHQLYKGNATHKLYKGNATHQLYKSNATHQLYKGNATHKLYKGNATHKLYKGNTTHQLYKGNATHKLYKGNATHKLYKGNATHKLYKSITTHQLYKGNTTHQLYKGNTTHQLYKGNTTHQLYKGNATHKVYKGNATHQLYKGNTTHQLYKGNTTHQLYKGNTTHQLYKGNTTHQLYKGNATHKLYKGNATHQLYKGNATHKLYKGNTTHQLYKGNATHKLYKGNTTHQLYKGNATHQLYKGNTTHQLYKVPDQFLIVQVTFIKKRFISLHPSRLNQLKHLLDEDYIRQREVWAAVNIQRIFRGFMARQYYQNLQQAEFDRQRKAVLTLQSHMRGFLARKKMELRMKEYKPSTRTKEWARQYKEELKQREAARAQKKHLVLIQLNKGAEKQDEQMKNVKAHQNIYDIYHPTPEGPTKAQKKAAAIIIQRYFRGWFVRRMYQKVKTKALKRTLSFNKFIKGYQTLLYRIQKRYGVTDPTTALQFNELMEYVERLNKYEIAFEKFAVNGTLSYNDIKEYFKACGHQPSQKEIDEAIEIVTKMSAKGRNLTKAEAVEVLFQIYVPKGTGLKLQDVRKSTWLNPLSEGQDIMQLLSKKDLEATNLGKCLEVVANAGKENDEIQELLRPSSARSESKASKKGEKNGKTKQATLAQYPMRPSSSSSSRAKSPKPYKTRR
ncbi:predicted protein [Nematostella vectensis]|uniref:Uncharacterized protein n=1 Tax=Nematostella vectensis TaxID=45351 RepID=A7RNC8_NEMVE|nr:predicted protein [Nematostella vectensis]|eukprot:XP_001639181.1 predicted protein [Nematostella vectensis]